MRTRNMTFHMVVCLLVSAAAGQSLLAGLATFGGDELELWTTHRRSVVVLKVEEVKPFPNARVPSEKMIIGTPLATIAGSFDPSEAARVSFKAWIGITATSNSEVPAVGSTVMAVIGYLEDGKPYIVSDLCSFMPPGTRGASICAIDGLDDPRVAETLKRVREARARGRIKAAAEAEDEDEAKAQAAAKARAEAEAKAKALKPAATRPGKAP